MLRYNRVRQSLGKLASVGTGPDGKLNDWWKYTSNPNAALP